MRSGSLLFTSESVSEGHPDKIADQVSDRILDAFLARDPDARVACETLLADQLVVVAGEFRTRNEAIFRDIEAAAESLVRQTLADIGYTDAATGIDPGAAGCRSRSTTRRGKSARAWTAKTVSWAPVTRA
jgi:S-adenosylmethionine synthetase